MTGDELVSHWDKIALPPGENLVLKTVQFFDFNVHHITAQASRYFDTAKTKSKLLLKERSKTGKQVAARIRNLDRLFVEFWPDNKEKNL